ncbi:MAG: hypothetical protein EYX74_06715 [Desulfobulbaceae bacterium]|nr:MAG: hypothetical protein EYX74_06715 [Desulfobulbaceae bacterium]
MKSTRSLLLLAMVGLLLLPGLSACAKGQPTQAGVTIPRDNPDFFGIGDDLARQLISNYRHGSRPDGIRLILTTLVSLDNLGETNRFGRTVSETLATQLFRRGFAVEEVRKAAVLMIKEPEGELVLSRDVSRLAQQHQAHAVVAGTYALTPQTVIINLRLLDAASHSVLSVAGLKVQRSAAINHMLAADSTAGFMDSALSGYER